MIIIIYINRYAESYNILLQENLSLKEEIKDIKQNLNLNKDIISSMFKDMKDKKKISYSNILQKLTQENVSIYKQIEKISSERNKLRSELIQIKEEKSSGQEQIAQENNKLKTKLFLMEQKLLKTENLYELCKKKLERKNSKIFKNNELNNNIRSKSQNNKNISKKNYTNPTNPTITNDKTNYNININNVNKKLFENIVEKKKNDINEENNEVYILEPTKALLKLNNELLFYKESHQQFLDKLKKKQETILKYENMINKLNKENSELRKSYKLKLMKVNNEKENILSMIIQNNLNIDEQSNNNNILNKNKKMSSGLSSTTIDNNDNSSNTYNTVHTLEQLNLNNNQLKKIINKGEVIGKETTLEEFGNILKSVGLTRELFEKMSQNKGFGKLTDSIEFFYKLCLEKNKQLLILEKENESLVFKNYELNKLNIELENELKLYKNNTNNNNKDILDKNINKNNIKKILDDNSIINNHTQKTNQNIIISKPDSDTNKNIENNLNINSIKNSINNNNNKNISIPLLNYKKLLEIQKEEEQLKQAEIIFNLSLDKENESSSSIKNSNNDDAEIMDNDNENENEEKDEDNKNDNHLYSNSNTKSLDTQFKELYNEFSNSNIDSILSKEFNKDSEENHNE